MAGAGAAAAVAGAGAAVINRQHGSFEGHALDIAILCGLQHLCQGTKGHDLCV